VLLFSLRATTYFLSRQALYFIFLAGYLRPQVALGHRRSCLSSFPILQLVASPYSRLLTGKIPLRRSTLFPWDCPFFPFIKVFGVLGVFNETLCCDESPIHFSFAPISLTIRRYSIYLLLYFLAQLHWRPDLMPPTTSV